MATIQSIIGEKKNKSILGNGMGTNSTPLYNAPQVNASGLNIQNNLAKATTPSSFNPLSANPFASSNQFANSAINAPLAQNKPVTPVLSNAGTQQTTGTPVKQTPMVTTPTAPVLPTEVPKSTGFKIDVPPTVPDTTLNKTTITGDAFRRRSELETAFTDFLNNQKTLQNQFSEASQMTQAEVDAQNRLNQVTQAERQGLQNIENKPIAMEFITGQQAAVQRQGQLDKLAASENLQALTGQRLSKLDSLKSQLGFGKDNFETLLGLKKEFSAIDKDSRDEARTTLSSILEFSKGLEYDELDAQSQQAVLEATANSPLSLGMIRQGLSNNKIAQQEALAKSRREGLMSVGENSRIFDTTTGKFITSAAKSSGTGTAQIPSQYAGALSVILGSGKLSAQQRKDVIDAVNNGEDPATVVRNKAKEILGTEGKEVTKYEVAKTQLQNINNTLSQYYANGGKTNVFKGSFEKSINSLGELQDPALVGIASEIQSALQVYRNAVSGTAYSVQEGKDIASIFPGINKSQGLNQAIINGRNKAFDSTIDGYYKTALGENAYNSIKNIGQVSDPLGLGVQGDPLGLGI